MAREPKSGPVAADPSPLAPALLDCSHLPVVNPARMRKLRPLLALLLVIATLWIINAGEHSPSTQDVLPAPPEAQTAPTVVLDEPTPREVPDSASPHLPDFLPPQAADTLALIARGGPYPHRQDGQVFGNRERRLPPRSRGHYREYTVATPGLSHRGPRRIVTGGQPPSEYWYTDDHYQSFRRFEVAR